MVIKFRVHKILKVTILQMDQNISQLITDPVQDYEKGSGKMSQSEYYHSG